MSTHNMPFINIAKENHPNYHKSPWNEFFLGTQERVRHSRGKRGISVRAIEVLMYVVIRFSPFRGTGFVRRQGVKGTHWFS